MLLMQNERSADSLADHGCAAVVVRRECRGGRPECAQRKSHGLIMLRDAQEWSFRPPLLHGIDRATTQQLCL